MKQKPQAKQAAKAPAEGIWEHKQTNGQQTKRIVGKQTKSKHDKTNKTNKTNNMCLID